MPTNTRFEPPAAATLRKLTVLIPARNEALCLPSTVRHLALELDMHGIDHEILVVDDASTDDSAAVLSSLAQSHPTLRVISNSGAPGFGRAVTCGLDVMDGDAVVIMMADESDDCRDVARYWRLLQQGYDCVFGSRFIRGGGTIDYPFAKLVLNRIVNNLIRVLFAIRLNDTTNAFKAYRRTAIDACRPLISPHFNLTVELPLKAIVRGLSWTVMPITWRNRRAGLSKLRFREMGSRYFFIIAYVWLEKYFSRGDYHRGAESPQTRVVAPVFAADNASNVERP